MAEESVQKWLGRNRPPRVQITYDLETRGAIEKKELPLVVGILADLAGTLKDETGQAKTETVADLKKRPFILIDRDNFEDVMKSIAPKLDLQVQVSPTVKSTPQTITFETIDDFTPDRLVEKVDALKKVLLIRQRLNDVVSLVDGAANPKGVLADVQTKVAAEIAALNSAKPTDPPVADVPKLVQTAADLQKAAQAAKNDPAVATASADVQTVVKTAGESADKAVAAAGDAKTAADALAKAADADRPAALTTAADLIGKAKAAVEKATTDVDAATKAVAALNGGKG